MAQERNWNYRDVQEDEHLQDTFASFSTEPRIGGGLMPQVCDCHYGVSKSILLIWNGMNIT